MSSVQSLASKHAVDPCLVQYTPKDRFTFNAAGTLRQPSTFVRSLVHARRQPSAAMMTGLRLSLPRLLARRTGTDDRNFISLRVELWAASADPFADKRLQNMRAHTH